MERINRNLIAPCGMNCGVCIAYLREKNRCQGCWKAEKKSLKPAFSAKSESVRSGKASIALIVINFLATD